MNQETLDFIRQHAADDVRKLALQASRQAHVDMPFALNQIAGRQKAQQKIPSWAAIEGLIYPPHISMEQCSSEQTACYKARLAERLVGDVPEAGMADLTGGFGVDFSFMARRFRKAVYVEQQQHLCEAARHNFELLGLPQAEVVCGDGVDYLHQMTHTHLIYVDPARRDTQGKRTYDMTDCTPDITKIADEIAGKCDFCIIKLSPMLDWHQAVAALEQTTGDGHEKHVTEVHIISLNNECKELLLVFARHNSPKKTIYCVNDEKEFVLDISQTAVPPLCKTIPLFTPAYSSLPGCYLYEPNASIMKAGCFEALADRYDVKAVGRNSHLFISAHSIDGFPGRSFVIERVTTLNKRELKTALAGINKANIAVRNFPLAVAELRKRLRLSDGGDCYIFATTAREKEHILLICRKSMQN